MPSNDWHPADIVSELKKSKTSLRRLSLESGSGPYAVQQALHRPYKKSEKIIADALSTTPQTIWPSRYNEDGTRRKGLYAKSPENKRQNNDDTVCTEGGN